MVLDMILVVVLIVQSVVIFLLTKTISDFLNKFETQEMQVSDGRPEKQRTAETQS